MKAWVHHRYGPADIVSMETVPRPQPKAGEILVKVYATSITTADWRLRTSKFPPGLWIPGRLVAGVLRPRHSIRGMEYAGIVEKVGAGVTNFLPGQRVFGLTSHDAHAQFLAVKADGCVLPTPAHISDTQAASLPFGGLCSLVFLRDVAKVGPGMEVLVVGASGGVGSYGVQIARHLGARVTGVASRASLSFVRGLGADWVLDYQQGDPLDGPKRYDVIFETIGAVSLQRARRRLTSTGLFVPLNFGVCDVLALGLERMRGRRSIVLSVNEDRANDLQTLIGLVGEGHIRPVIDTIYPFGAVRDAYRHVERRSRRGGIIVEVEH